MKDAKQYYRQIRDIDIGTVARDLLEGRITQEDKRLLQCNCPHHQSQSRRSLHIMLDKQGWYCFGCGVGGDVLQLVEFVQSGQVTRGQSGPMPESHRQARDFLAARVGLPPLSQWGLSAEQIAQAESTAGFHLRVQTALTETARYYHRRLRAHPEALAWLQSHYALSEETVDHLLIGYADNAPWEDEDTGTRVSGPVSWLTQQGGDFTLRELAASGAFSPTNQDGLRPFFANRLIFPYWQGGRVVFLIGRRTPWTPREPWERAKYKKLPVHDESGHEHIAACIDNGVLYNEDVLLTRPDHVIITEGVTDCLALMEAGQPAVSPVTVNIRQADWERLVPRLKDIKTVYICQDNELSGAGLRGALRTAHVLAEQGIDTRLVALPLEEGHRAARDQLAARFGLARTVSPRDLKEKLAGRPAEELAEAERLLAAAKVDVNGYFLAGHSAEEFGELLAQAQTPLEHAIGSLPTDLDEPERNRRLEPLLEAIARLSPLEQGRHLKLTQARVGKETLSLTELRQQVRELQRRHRHEERARRQHEQQQPTAPEGTCQAAVEKVLLESKFATGSPDHARAAEAAYQWLCEYGARFFRTSEGEPFVFCDQEIYWMDSGDRTRRRLYAALVHAYTGQVTTTAGGRIFHEVLANLAVQRGEVRDQFGWLHSDLDSHTVYFNLNNDEHQLAKIGPEGVELIANGGNAEGVILDRSPKVRPIHYLPEVDLEEADRLFEELVLDHLTCPVADRYLILSWVACFLLLDFAGTRPMVRFEGPTGSAKTTGSKLFSTTIYGEQVQKTSTDAANYVDGARHPLLILDNVETTQVTDDLVKFILTAITGIAKEKRKAGTDSETVIESTKCLINTTGIEPLGGELGEVLSRSFVIRFDASAGHGYFLEAAALNRLRQHRDMLLSALMKRTSRVLALLREGAQERVMHLLHEALGSHPKRRCNDYLTLMYLMMLAGAEEATVEASLEKLHPRFLQMIGSLNDTTEETARESNPITTTLNTLFRAYRQALEADRQTLGLPGARARREAFLERYQVDFADEHTIVGVMARDLFVALRRVAKEFNLSFSMKSVQQFAQRFCNDLPAIRAAGFEVTINELGNRRRSYTIRQLQARGESAHE
jgi:DNA primase